VVTAAIFPAWAVRGPIFDRHPGVAGADKSGTARLYRSRRTLLLDGSDATGCRRSFFSDWLRRSARSYQVVGIQFDRVAVSAARLWLR
jgi:hypothetical protein